MNPVAFLPITPGKMISPLEKSFDGYEQGDRACGLGSGGVAAAHLVVLTNPNIPAGVLPDPNCIGV